MFNPPLVELGYKGLQSMESNVARPSVVIETSSRRIPPPLFVPFRFAKQPEVCFFFDRANPLRQAD